jgi:hypothetical protein
MPKLTKRIVEAAEVKPAEYMLWDGELPGFGVRVMPSGRRSYMVQYRAGRRSRRMVLGPHGVLTADRARSMAVQVLAEVRTGSDPAGVRKERREALTVAELAERFDKEHIAVHLKESTAKETGATWGASSFRCWDGTASPMLPVQTSPSSTTT